MSQKTPRLKISKIWGLHHALSPYRWAEFSIGEEKFNSFAQYYNIAKCRKFQDEDAYYQCCDLQLHPHLTRIPVRKFNKDIWEQEVNDVIYEGIKPQFEQNDGIRKYLLMTDPNYLAYMDEGYDPLLGTGYKRTDKLSNQPSKYKGKNYWGINLMRLRTWFIENPEYAKEVAEARGETLEDEEMKNLTQE